MVDDSESLSKAEIHKVRKEKINVSEGARASAETCLCLARGLERERGMNHRDYYSGYFFFSVFDFFFSGAGRLEW